jgi:predicted MPP superfamily phosphohydrolase
MKKDRFTAKSKRNIRVFKLFVISLIFVCIAASVAVVGCNYIENRNFKETFYCVSSLKVNNKIRVVQISDLHNSSFGEENQKLVSRIEKLKPDLIIYTGDCIDSKTDAEDNALNLCKKLSTVAPSYYIYGNNEVEKYYDNPLTQDSLDEKFGFNDENRDPTKLLEITDSLTEKLEKSGVKVLKNSFDTITIGNTEVDVYGVLTSNPSSFWSYAGKTFDEFIFTNENRFKITAIHEPVVFETYFPDTWGDLMLAGHTHGGTVKIPIIGPLYTREGGFLPAKNGHYIYGRSDVQGRPLIVSSGLENNNLFRLNNQPEIVIVDVNKF